MGQGWVFPLMRAVPIATCILLLLVPAVAATPEPPSDMQATYSTTTQTLTLTWSQDASLPEPAGWKVYRDDQYVTTVTARTYSDDLSSWAGGATDYHVTAYDGNVESKASAIVHVTKAPGTWPLGCAPVTIVITSLVPPQVYPGVDIHCIVV